jgi:eukaryotic-like serine/threonine-protein kinase
MKLQFSKKYNNNTLGGLLLHAVVAASIILLLAVIYFYVYLPSSTNHDETITVPNVEGMAIEKVAKFLEEHDLRYEINDSSYSSEYPPLTILKQVPVAGAKVKENRKIYLSINRIHPPTVPMPDLIDGSLVNADAVLRGSELKRGRIELVRGPFLNVVKGMKINGHVVEPGARVPKGTVVDLIIMDGGTDRLPVPNVLGMKLDDAEFLILGQDLSVGAVRLLGDTTGGVIVKQNPLPGETIRVGDIVDLWIGKPGSDPENGEPMDGDTESGDENID